MSTITARTGVTGVIVRPAPRPRPGWKRSKKKLKRVLRYVVIVFTLVIVLLPIYEMVLGVFQPAQWELTWPPAYFFKGWNWSALSSVFKSYPLGEWLAHSFLVSAITVSITVVCAIPGGYLLSRLRWRGAAAFGFLLLFTQLMPGAMIIVPELEWYRTLNWTNNLLALGLVYAAFSVPVGCWIMKSAFDVIPERAGRCRSRRWVHAAGNAAQGAPPVGALGLDSGSDSRVLRELERLLVRLGLHYQEGPVHSRSGHG